MNNTSAEERAEASSWFGGARTLEEQMLGLGPALVEANGKTVLDVGCAEGDIGIAFAREGASLVVAFDNNPDMSFAARAKGKSVRNFRPHLWDMNSGPPKGEPRTYDIVLALAVLHKATRLRDALLALTKACSSLLVLRLPAGCTGILRAKHGGDELDLVSAMVEYGFRLERSEIGPRGEAVQYWRRV